ncbi:hypothetical protein [Legionella cardiaca]|uniref:Uncharacterized protein n=1 Tax=Legionella cardiaca TaxID=1071983 RepID=A0ABY8AU69_9GAMM|nr:hypothetical protein [Legionella cardiaca]WED44235.1 hypothetical protein PXX05_05475 [Legionella cardiaca]
MFNELIANIFGGLSKIDNLLNQDAIDEASQVLTRTSSSFNILISNIPIDNALQRSLLPLLRKELTEISTKFYLALTYKRVDGFNTATQRYDFPQAKQLYQEIISLLKFMKTEYLHAAKDGKEQTPVFVDFFKQYSHLLRSFEEAVNKYNAAIKVAQVCNNLTKAFNFGETQRQFGLNLEQRSRYTLFPREFPITKETADSASNLTL